jgi:hypothetical protein
VKLAAILPILAFVLVATTVGVRLLLLSRRTRQLPELSIGLGLSLIPLLGMPLSAMGRVPALVGTDLGNAALTAGVATVCVGIALFFVFTWRVFRAASFWATGLVIAAFAFLAVIPAGFGFAGWQQAELEEILPRTRPWAMSMVGMLMLALAWTGIESLRYHRLMRRRRALGLADPVVVNRFLLWGVGSLAGVLLCTSNIAFLLAGISILVEPAALYLIAATGTVMAATWYFTFLPPERYLSFLRRGAEEG